MYSLPEPPYFLLVVGLFAGITCGVAFEAALKEKVQEWSKNRSTRNLAQMRGNELFIPFVGICVGICVFLSAGLEIFTLPMSLGYAISIPLTLFIGWLIWSQLGNVLSQLEKGGSKALDLDSFE